MASAMLLVSIQADPRSATFARLMRMDTELLRQKIEYLKSLLAQGILVSRNGRIH